MAAALWAAGAGHHASVSEADRARFAAACEQIRGAAGEPVPGGTGFRGRLAAACEAARSELDAGEPTRRIAAARLLVRIARLSETVGAMNAERGARGGASVTDTGEFLIAHRLGVVNALDRWVHSGAELSLASHP